MVLVQDTASAAFPEMPLAALSLGAPNYVLPLDLIGPAVAALVCHAGVEALFRPAGGSRQEPYPPLADAQAGRSSQPWPSA
jgi:hypothetical protein